MELSGELMGRPLDPNRPLWEIHVIEGLTDRRFPDGSLAVFSKTHHCAIDGVSGMEITTALHDLEPDPETELSADAWRPERIPSQGELLLRSYGRAAARGMELADLAGRSMRSAARVGAGVARGEVPPPTSPFTAPPTLFNREVSPRRVLDGRFFDLDRVRAVKRAIEGATVNDVALAICAGGLRSFLAARGRLPARPLVAMTPVSVRDAEEKSTLGNQVSAMLVPLATDEPDPRARLEAIHRSTVGSKAYTSALGAKLMSELPQFLPSATAGLAVRAYSQLRGSLLHPPIFNCVITNVPGPQFPLYSCGSRLLASLGAGPIFDGMGLFIAVGSYCGELVLSVTACRDMLPQPAELCDAFVESFAELEHSVGVARPRARRKPARREAPAFVS